MDYLQYAFALILLWCNHFQTYDAEPIRGGYFDEEEEALWVVSIQRKVKDKWTHICSGSLINQQDVVTAAHCFVKLKCQSSELNSATINHFRDLSRKEHRIVIGLKDLKETSENRGIKKGLLRVFIPNDYRQSSSHYKWYSDIAVLRMDTPLNELDAIKHPNEKYGFINLPDEEDQNVDIDGKQGFAAGYGAVDARKYMSNKTEYTFNGLRKILKVNFSVLHIREIPTLKHVRHIGEATTAQGFAKGDSGGPVYTKDDINNNNLFKLVGVISSGPCHGDLRYKTGKVTFVPEYLKFLNTVTKLDRNRIFNERSVKQYDESGLEYFALPDHNKIVRFKLFLNKRIRSPIESQLKTKKSRYDQTSCINK